MSADDDDQAGRSATRTSCVSRSQPKCIIVNVLQHVLFRCVITTLYAPGVIVGGMVVVTTVVSGTVVVVFAAVVVAGITLFIK